MRAAILGLAASVIAGQALAADYLRGSTYEAPKKAAYRWDGVYVGGQAGYANTDFEFGPTTRSLVARMLRNTTVESEFGVSNWPSLPNRDARGGSYGGFVGYNAQWGDIVLGVELNYNRTSIRAESNDVIARRVTTSDGLINDIAIVSQASGRLTDYGGLRFRAGYAMDWIMPYAMVGLAFGNTHYTRQAGVALLQNDPNNPPPVLFVDSIYEAKNNAVTVGYSAGFGVDVGLTQNIFLRGEYEFMQLAAVGGISYRINTVRAGAGLKF
jgi:outer membrane immunogenic protein